MNYKERPNKTSSFSLFDKLQAFLDVLQIRATETSFRLVPNHLFMRSWCPTFSPGSNLGASFA